MKLQTESPICDKNNIRKKEKTRNTIDFFLFIFPQQPTKYIILQFLPSSAQCRAEKSGEAFRKQKFKGMCVPEVSNQLRTIFFQF